MDLLDRLLAEDGDGFMRESLRREFEQPGPAHREMTFNVFDATLDFDGSSVLPRLAGQSIGASGCMASRNEQQRPRRALLVAPRHCLTDRATAQRRP